MSIALLTGDICDGKTLVLEELCAFLSLGRPVFVLRNAYDDILEETARILDSYQNAACVIENCFDLSHTRLSGIARQFDNSDAVLVLSSRNIAAEAKGSNQTILDKFATFRHYRLQELDEGEARSFVEITDQIAAWSEFNALTRDSRLRFISRICDGSLPGFLLRLLRSNHVRERYIQEYRKTENLHPAETRAAIAALYVAHIGYSAPISFLSDIFEIDVGAAFDRLGGRGSSFRLVRRQRDLAKTVPSIGATMLLREVIEPREVVDTIVQVMAGLSSLRPNNDFVRHMFTQMMRYSILAAVVDNRIQINRFFDNVSKIPRCREQVLFWVQWHMAMTDQHDFVAAERFLNQAYKEARSYRQRFGVQYDSKQIDDRKAKFLMIRGRYTDRSVSSVFEDFVSASRIVRKLLGRDDLTHHPFETLREIAELFGARSSEFSKSQRDTAYRYLDALSALGTSVHAKVPAGYQSGRAMHALERVAELKEL